MKEVRNSRFCTELSKTQFFPVSIVKQIFSLNIPLAQLSPWRFHEEFITIKDYVNAFARKMSIQEFALPAKVL